MTAIGLALSGALAHFLWQGAAVALLLWVALLLLRNRSANARYAASCVALAAMAALPVITACILYKAPNPTRAASTVDGAFVDLMGAMPAHSSLPLRSWALYAWAAGVLVFSLRLVWSSRQVYRLRRRGTEAESPVVALVTSLARRMGVTRAVRVLISPIADGPGVIGWLRPVILIPAATLAGLTPEQLETILAHELAHIRRYDYLVNLLQIVIETLLFYHPAVWWASARIRHERELCCDDAAVRACRDAVCYARALTRLERLRLVNPGLGHDLAMGSTDGALAYRIRRLTGTSEQSPSRCTGIVVLALALVCSSLSVNWARGQVGERAVVERTRVEYPGSARERGIQGTVAVEVTLDERGSVTDARVVGGPTELRRAALGSVLNWHFAPAAGVTSQVVNIEFRPEENQAKEPPVEPRNAAQKAEERRLRARISVNEDQAREPISEQDLRRRLERETRLQNLETTRRFLESQLKEPQTERLAAALSEQIAAVNQTLQTIRGEPLQTKAPFPQKLISLQILDLSAAATSDLSSRLPVRLGDMLTQESIDELVRVVHLFDEHLTVECVALREGRGAAIRILPDAPQQ